MIKALRLKLDDTKQSELKRVLEDYINNSERGTAELFTEKIPRWRQIYNGEPFQAVKSFPWHRASNFVVPLVGIHVDTLVARILSLVFKTDPLFTCSVFGNLPEYVKSDIEDFLKFAALDETELALYRICREWLFDIVKLGTSVVKVPFETETEMIVEPGLVQGQQPSYKQIIKYDGPKPSKVPYTDFLLWPLGVTDLRKALIKMHKVYLEKDELLQRGFAGFYDQDIVTKIINRPDKTNPSAIETQQEEQAGVRTIGQQRFTLYECWFKFQIQQGTFVKIIATYHKDSKELVRTIYNPYVTGDDLDDIFVDGRLFPRDDMWYGRGFAEMLEQSQEEASTIHNQRRDNATIANTQVVVARKNAFLDFSFPLFPNKPIFCDDINEDVRFEKLGQPTGFSFEEEKVALDLAERRSGVSPPMIGFGAGQGGKRGVYTAMGTLSMLQEGNMRTDLNIMDVRDSIARVGRLALKGYALGGIHQRLGQKFGQRLPRILAAVTGYDSMQLRLTASSASLNKEVEKQNNMMLAQTMAQYYQQIMQLVTQMQQMGNNKEIAGFMLSIYQGSKVLMTNILRSFESGDIDRILPTLPSEKQQQSQPAPLGPQVQPQGPIPFPGMASLPGSSPPVGPENPEIPRNLGGAM